METKPKLIHKRFKLPKGCNAKEVVLRETNGLDEQSAAMQHDTRNGRTTIFAELVRVSIVSVDGERVTQPFIELEHWNSRTRAFINEAYTSLNHLDEKEMDTFLIGAEDVTPGGAETTNGIPAKKERGREAAAEDQPTAR